MKRIISNVMLIAAAATAFFSCQKQESLAPEKAQDVVLTFSSEKPSFTDETKTEWTGTTVQWSAGDKISIAYTVNGNWQNASGDASADAKLYKSEALKAAAETAQFNVSTSFKGTTEGTHVFYGVYPAPSETLFSEAPVATLTVPAIQTPGAASFDGAADLMTGVSVGEFTSRPADAETISMKWTRLVAHANITLKALKDVTAGEKVLSITLTAQDDANLVGKQKVNILTNEFENNDATSNVLKINGANLSVDSGNIEFWACVLPETITALTVVVDTDKATYTREITGISNKTFKQNARNILSINMSEAMREEKLSTAFYEKVTSQLNDWSGKYLLVVENDVNQALCGISTTSTKYGLGFSVDIDNNKIVASGLSAYEVVIAKASVTADAYTMTFNGSQLYWGSANSLNVNVAESVNTNWTISLNNGKLYIYNCKDVNRQLLWNKSSPRFACYTGKEEDAAYFYPHLYKLVDDNQGGEVPEPEQPVAPKIEVPSAAQSIGAEGGDLEFEYTVTNTDSELEATVTQGADFLESVEVDNDIIAVTVKENETASERIAKITLTCGDATPVVLTITQYGAEVDAVKMTVAEFIDAEDDTLCELTGTITGIVAAYDKDFNNISFNLSDDTGVVQIYRMSCAAMTADPSTLTVGDEITVQGTKTTYNGTVQMAAGGKYISHTDKEAPSVSIIKKTVAEFLTLTGSETDKYELTGVVAEIYQAYNPSFDNISFYIEDETGKVLIFRMDCAGDASLASLKVGDKVTVQGNPTPYNGTIQMAQGGVCTSYTAACDTPVINCEDNIVTITTTEAGATIYCTTDGTDPTISSEQLYSASFEITETKTVKAIAVAEGKATSVIASKVCMYVDPNAEGKVPSSTACYTLTTSTAGSNNSYAGNCDITVGGITWNLTGNSTTNPWRMGGKSLNGVDRVIYSKTAYPSALSKVEFVSGTMNVTSWNSLKLEYSTSADFTDAQTIEASEVGASKTITFAPEGGFPANCYFRFVLNITVKGDSNKYVQLKNIIFYGYEN